MAFVPTNSTLEEAITLTADGKFPYYHPCCKCSKACSMPTRPLWDKRVTKFGSIEAVYTQYVCRDCGKGLKAKEVPPEKEEGLAQRVEVIAVTNEEKGGGVSEPTGAVVPVASMAPPPARAFRREPRPGDPIAPRPGYVGVTVWVEGKPVSSSWTHLGGTKE